jgi:hypothetical protein
VARRPVDIAVNNFLKAIGVVVALLVGLQLWILVVQDHGPNEAFTWATIGVLVCTLLVLWMAKRRPVEPLPTWGEAMVGAAFSFAFMLLAYGVWPHQWLVYADSELSWRSDRFVLGPDVGLPDGQGLIEFVLPFQVPYLVIRDLIAVAIYGVGLAGLIALWSIWQKRGAVAETTVEKSTFGRPLVREGAEL